MMECGSAAVAPVETVHIRVAMPTFAVALPPPVAQFPTSCGHEPRDIMAESTSNITRDAIQTARSAFARRVAEAEATVGGLSFDDIVIARHVTPAQLERVPSAWLRGVKVLLRADGTLLITNLRTHQHHDAVIQLTCQVANWTRVNDLHVGHERSLIREDNAVVTPDVQVHELLVGPYATGVPLALLEVEAHHRCMHETVATACAYLTSFPTVECVVFLKFYPPRQPDLVVDHQLRVPAIAIVFCRSTTNAGKIEVAQMLSFGNAEVDDHVFQTLLDPDCGIEPFVVQDHHRAPAPWLHGPFTIQSLVVELKALRSQEERGVLNVGMPRDLPAIEVDLLDVFIEAMLGWVADPAGVQARQFLRVSTTAE